MHFLLVLLAGPAHHAPQGIGGETLHGKVLLHLPDGHVGLAVDGLGRVLDTRRGLDHGLQHLVQVFGFFPLEGLGLEALAHRGFEVVQGFVGADHHGQIIVHVGQVTLPHGVQGGGDGGGFAGHLFVFIILGHRQLKGPGLAGGHADHLPVKAGQGVDSVLFEEQLIVLIVHDRLVVGGALVVHDHLVAHLGRTVHRHPLGKLLALLLQVGLDILVGHFLGCEINSHGAIVPQIDFGLDGEQHGHAEGVPLYVLELADVIGLVLDLFQRLLVQIVAELFEGLLLHSFAAKDADHGVIGRTAAAIAGHRKLARELARGLAQFFVDLGRVHLDDDVDLAVVQPFGCDFHVDSHFPVWSLLAYGPGCGQMDRRS